jgi:hypothetical protein
MRCTTITYGLLLFSGAVLGQPESASELIRIRPREDPSKIIPFSKRYRYEPFLYGHAIFSNGRASGMYRFNYDFLFGEMRIIKKTGADTLFVVNDEALRYVFIGNDIFHHDIRKGYILLLAEAHTAKLGVRHILKKKRNEAAMNSGYGLITDYTSAIYSQNDVMLENRAYFYFITDDNLIHKASRANLLRIFPQYRNVLESYLAENNISFHRQTDLDKLFAYCSKLP